MKSLPELLKKYKTNLPLTWPLGTSLQAGPWATSIYLPLPLPSLALWYKLMGFMGRELPLLFTLGI